MIKLFEVMTGTVLFLVFIVLVWNCVAPGILTWFDYSQFVKSIIILVGLCLTEIILIVVDHFEFDF